ncbi:MAG: hypothetical protein ACREWI_08140 [Telluria sp.]
MRHRRIIAGTLCGLLFAAAAQASAQDEQESAVARKPTVPEYERVGRFIYAFHRAGLSPEKLADPLIARRAPPELAQRAADLAEKFDAIVKQRARLPDEELKATLREAEHVSAALARWRNGETQQE